MFRIAVATVHIVCWVCAQTHAGVVGIWPLNDGHGSIARNLVRDAGDGFMGAPGIITNAESGGVASDLSDPDTGSHSVWVLADDFPTGPRIVWGTGGQSPTETAYIRAGNVPPMTFDNNFTWTFFAQTDPNIADRPGQFAGIVGNRYKPGGGDFEPREFMKFTPTQFEFHANATAAPNLLYHKTATGDPSDLNDMPLGEWHYHALVKRGDRLFYYRDGRLWNSDVMLDTIDEAMPLWFGGDDAGDADEQWHGRLSCVQLFDSALTQHQITDIVSGFFGPCIVPEPESSFLLILGIGGIFAERRRPKAYARGGRNASPKSDT